MFVLCIVGKSASGKDTLVNNLLKNCTTAIQKAVSYTTRPRREGEVDGIDYHYVTVEQFQKMKDENKFIEETSYNVNGETWYYGFTKDTFTNYPGITIAIINPRGLEALVKDEELREHMAVLYLVANEEIRKDRYYKRDSALEKDTIRARWFARVKQDREDFNKINKLIDRNNIECVYMDTSHMNIQNMVAAAMHVIGNRNKIK